MIYYTAHKPQIQIQYISPSHRGAVETAYVVKPSRTAREGVIRWISDGNIRRFDTATPPLQQQLHAAQKKASK